MTFGEQNTLSQSFQLLDKAFDAGINFFDSAEMYPTTHIVPFTLIYVHAYLSSLYNLTILLAGIQCHRGRKLREGVRSILAVG